MIKTIIRVAIGALIAYLLINAQGCTRHVTKIVLHHPDSVKYAEAMQVER